MLESLQEPLSSSLERLTIILVRPMGPKTTHVFHDERGSRRQSESLSERSFRFLPLFKFLSSPAVTNQEKLVVSLRSRKLLPKLISRFEVFRLLCFLSLFVDGVHRY